MHGKTSMVTPDGKTIFTGFNKPFKAMRYHSLIGDPASMPDCLEVIARTSDNVIMGIRHRLHPIHGVQFHPESIGTELGKQLLNNFLEMER